MLRKINFFFFLSSILVLGSCLKSSAPTTGDLTNSNKIIQGNFSGPFVLIHKSPLTGKLDTANATVTLALSNGTYTVGGDTTKIQSPSYGSFTFDGLLINFTDATVTKKTNLNVPKKHLTGPYQYTYNGSSLHIFGASDTLNYDYNLTSF